MKQSSFHTITENQFIDKNFTSESINKSDILFKQGDKIKYIYYLEEGELNVIKNKLMMWQAHADDFIGLSSFFNNAPNYSYTVKACMKSKVIKISLSDFKSALNKSPKLNSALMTLFCERIKLTLEKIKIHSSLSKKKRLVKLLVNKACHIDVTTKIILNYSSLDISEFINIPHKLVKNILLELQSKKLLKLNKNVIEILDLQGLKLVLRMKII